MIWWRVINHLSEFTQQFVCVRVCEMRRGNAVVKVSKELVKWCAALFSETGGLNIFVYNVLTRWRSRNWRGTAAVLVTFLNRTGGLNSFSCCVVFFKTRWRSGNPSAPSMGTRPRWLGLRFRRSTLKKTPMHRHQRCLYLDTRLHKLYSGNRIGPCRVCWLLSTKVYSSDCVFRLQQYYCALRYYIYMVWYGSVCYFIYVSTALFSCLAYFFNTKVKLWNEWPLRLFFFLFCPNLFV